VPVLVAATGNAGKLAEIAAFLAPSGLDVRGLSELADTTPVEETGATFEANARLKAEEYSRRTPHLVLADDSGLTDEERCHVLLVALADVPDDRRTARFRCVIAVARDGRLLATVEGAVEGTILRESRGTNGFGYDPVFFHPPSGCSFAELTRAQKQNVPPETPWKRVTSPS